MSVVAIVIIRRPIEFMAFPLGSNGCKSDFAMRSTSLISELPSANELSE